MKPAGFDWKPVAGTVLLAAALWFWTFYMDWGVFWYKIAASALILAALAFLLQPEGRLRLALNPKTIGLGMGSAVLLYLIFWAGKSASTALLPFAGEQIGSIYGKGEGTPVWRIALLLFFVTSPCEEIYWRGDLQKKMMTRFGGGGGGVLAPPLFSGGHIWCLNFMLIGAAAVAGAFWGGMYWRLNDLSPVIISHAIWSTSIFVVMPVP